MRRGILLFFLVILIPTTIFALDFSGTNLPYNDVPEGTPEAAGISVLTREGVLRGYADGAFRPKNLLNRAEFLKIVLESRYVLFLDSYTSPQFPCFPDVPSDAWYSTYVCFAKQEGMVSGFPLEGVPSIDWKFHPERSVTYAEALKMLSTLYHYAPTYEDGDAWYSSFLRSALSKGVALPVGTELGAPLTRGQMARLTAAYLSESKGFLDAYRKSERGEYIVTETLFSSSSSSSEILSSSSSSSVVSSSASSSSSVSSKKSFYTLPAQSHFLVVGETSDALASGTLYPEEESEITAIEVRLINEASSIENFEITTESGVVITTLPRRTTADRPDFRKIYEVAIESGKGYRIMPSASGTNIILRARIRSQENLGVADQYVEVISWNITLQGKVSNTTKSVNIPAPFPAHQTAFGRMLPVQVLSAATDSLHAGTGIVLGRFTFSGSRLQGKSLALENLLFTVDKTVGVHLGNLRLRSMVWPYTEHACTLNLTALSCTNLPADMNTIAYGKGLIVELRGDIGTTTIKTKNFLKVSLGIPGGPSELGSVQWTDGSGHYRWMEGVSPLASGTSWTEE